MNDNPLLVESTLPFRYPPFDRIRNEHFAPAFEAGMAEHAKEIEAIAKNPDKPTFENTIVAMERAGQLLARTSRIFFNLAGTNTNPEMQKLQRAIAPKLAAHSDSITLDPVLFARVAALYEAKDSLEARPGVEPVALALSPRLRSRRCEALGCGQTEAEGLERGTGISPGGLHPERPEGGDGILRIRGQPGRSSRA